LEDGPLTQIRYRGRMLTVTLGTGATQTTLNPLFGKLFPELLQQRTADGYALNGLSGTSVQRSITLPHLALTFGRDVELAPAIRFSQDED
jgi:hypothetical protein